MKSSKFIGDTKGNRDINHNLSKGKIGSGAGRASGKGKAKLGGKFAGGTRGNRDLPINRSTKG